MITIVVANRGLEPRWISPNDFESFASANSANSPRLGNNTPSKSVWVVFLGFGRSFLWGDEIFPRVEDDEEDARNGAAQNDADHA